jgi:hypothetical protein
VQFVTLSFVAPLMKRMVLVLAVADTVVFDNVRLTPPELTPSIVTLSAPAKSISGLPAAIAPETVRAPPAGAIRIEVYDDEPVPLAFKTAATVSVVLPRIQTLIEPWCVPALMASKAAFTVA